MWFNREAFEKLILEEKVLGLSEKEFKLVSGRISNFYVNWRLNDVLTLDQVSNHILDYFKDLSIEFDCIYGVPEGVTRLANMTQVKFAKMSPNYKKGSHVLPMGRAKPKDYGDPKDRYFVGAPKGKVILLEDITTTAGSLINKGIKPLQERGINVVGAVVLTDRGIVKGYNENQTKEETGVDCYPMSYAFDILPEACRRDEPSEQIKQSLREEFKDYGELLILD